MSAESRLIDAVLAYLGRRMGPGTVLRGVRLEVEAGGMKQEIRLKTPALGVSGDADEGGATPIRRAVLEVLTDAGEPLKGQAIARRASRSYSGTFRSALASVVREGELLLTEEGYVLAEQDEQDSEVNDEGG